MEAFLTSVSLVTLSEIGDKTQLLALMLAVRFRRPAIIILGILAATLVNHTFAGYVGGWIRAFLPPHLLPWILGIAFIVMGLWILIPDKIEECEQLKQASNNETAWKIFTITFSTFFLAEMGDKTQLVTVNLAASFNSLFVVIAGSTIGMLLADVPAIWIGHCAACKIPLKLIHSIAAIVFILIGGYIIYFGLPDHPTGPTNTTIAQTTTTSFSYHDIRSTPLPRS